MPWKETGVMNEKIKMIGDWLRNTYPEKPWPAASTAQAILKREGWVKTRHRRRHTPSYTEPFKHAAASSASRRNTKTSDHMNHKASNRRR